MPRLPRLPLPGLALALAVPVALASAPAHATLEISLQQGANTYFQSGASPLTVTQSIGSYSVTVNTGTSSVGPALDLSSADIASSAGGILTVILSQNDLTSPVGLYAWLSNFSGHLVSGAGFTATLKTYIDNTNTLLGTGTLLSTLSGTSAGILTSATAFATTSSPFALTEVLTINASGATHTSLDGSVAAGAAVPEPASLALLGCALGGMGLARRRTRRA